VASDDTGAPADSLDRALAFMRAGLAATADAVRTIDAGVILSTPSLPAVWVLNQLRVTRAPAFEDLLDLAEEQLADFEYRQIAVEDQAAGPALEASFRAAQWQIERDRLMVLAGPPDRPADTSFVIEPGEAEVLGLIRRWYEEDEPAPGAVEQFIAYARREARALGDRLLGVRSRDGALVAIAKLRSDGRTAQVEDVYTVPEARGRGFARAVVGRAANIAREAGHELIFIVADDAGWPKRLYERLGFRSAGLLWQFHRD
jgi:ribosomal protein S18 acetylase RimI-like enzyme